MNLWSGLGIRIFLGIFGFLIFCGFLFLLENVDLSLKIVSQSCWYMDSIRFVGISSGVILSLVIFSLILLRAFFLGLGGGVGEGCVVVGGISSAEGSSGILW